MDREFIEKCRQILEDEKKEIIASLADQNEQMKGLIGTSETGDEADIASDKIDSTLLDSLGAAAYKRLTQINSALDRIKQNKFGKCLVCGKEIPEGRLEALPYAALCIDCQTKADRQNR